MRVCVSFPSLCLSLLSLSSLSLSLSIYLSIYLSAWCVCVRFICVIYQLDINDISLSYLNEQCVDKVLDPLVDITTREKSKSKSPDIKVEMDETVKEGAISLTIHKVKII